MQHGPPAAIAPPVDQDPGRGVPEPPAAGLQADQGADQARLGRSPQQHFAYTIHQWAGQPGCQLFDAAVRRAVLDRSNGLSYFVGQLERAPGTGKLHLQCYAQVSRGVDKLGVCLLS